MAEVSGEVEGDEITLKELILKVKGYGAEIWRNWLLVGLITLPVAGYMFYSAWSTKPTYTAKLTFMLNDAQSSGGGGGLASFLGALGGGDAGQFNLNKIVELSKSRRIIRDALFTRGVIDGKEDFYANHLIRDFDFLKGWEKDTTGLKGFLFTRANFDDFSRVEKSAFFKLYERVMDKSDPLFSSSFSKQSSILELSLKTRSEELAIQLTNVIYAKLSAFYITNSIEKQEHTVEILKGKTDSLKRLMQGKESEAAHFEDTERGLLFESDKVKSKLLRGEAQVSGLGYAEVMKNLEIADFSLKNNIPFIRAIDLPYAPIKPEKKSKLVNLLIGLVVGGLLGSVFVILRKVFREALA